jgi:hypothetical protein
LEVNHTALETAFVQQFELQADVCGEGPFTISHHYGRDEQVALVYQPGPECLGGEVGPPTPMSRSACVFSRRNASGSKSRSIRVLALATASSVLEYTILSAACHIWA